jgi:hypothetical protein
VAAVEHTAAGPAAGYLFQLERVFYWLAESPDGAVVGIETLDDVAVLNQDGTIIREQDKHTVKEDKSPLGGRSRNLWHTLRIWCEAIRKESDPNKTEFYLVTNGVLEEGIAKRLSVAKSAVEVDQCIRELVSLGEAPAGGIKEDVAAVLADEATLRFLIPRIRCIDVGVDPEYASQQQKAISRLHISSHEPQEDIVKGLMGWLLSTVLYFWREEQPAWITRAAFDNCLERIRDSLRRKRFRESPALEILVTEAERIKHLAWTFVRQLDAICLDRDEVYEAIDDFIRCSKERSRLSREGNVAPDDWVNFEGNLVQRWRMIIREERLDARTGRKPARGRKVFYRTTNHREPLAGEPTTEYYLTKGSYHRLANDLKVGWHSEYLKKFSAILAEETANGRSV